MKNNNAEELLEKYFKGTCTPQEKQWVEDWYLSEISRNHGTLEDTDYNAAKSEIWSKIKKRRHIKLKKASLIPRIAAAAIILLSIGIGAYLQITPSKNIQSQNLIADNVIEPGGNKAILTLSNGKRISLTTVANGELAKDAGMKITKTTDGQLVYEISDAISYSEKAEVFNTIETPFGGQYLVKLPDGTKVWLNAASSLRYPVNFKDSERKVELSGEGYFEVAHNKAAPFIVVSGKQTVKVLGTHFNVNTYADEPFIKTTLLEGSVQVSNHHNVNKTLKPGQQALLNGPAIEIISVDSEQAIAWKKGDFAFEGTTLESIMRQISRWYNVEVVYQGTIAEVEFGGSISRSKSVNEVLKVLQMTQGVHFKLEGRRILVMP